MKESSVVWAQGDSVVSKLSRFEEAIARLESSRQGEAVIFQPPVAAPVSAPSQQQQSVAHAPAATVEESPSSSFHSNATYSVSARSAILSPSSTTAASSYRGLASGGSAGGRMPLARAASEMTHSTTGGGSSNGSVGGGSVTGSRTGSETAGPQRKGPLVFPKRQTPPVPLTKSMSTTFQ